ncbi:MAG: CBS domain-containing protein, partial [Deltaproteobacteria bacterium]|nr:CBS domain-containing protein [Deltaproteobacteria bacterium]
IFNETKEDNLIVIDQDGKLAGIITRNDLKKEGESVLELINRTDAWLSGRSSLKDGLSEIYTHDLGFLIVVDDEKKVIGWLHTEEIKNALRD